MRKLNLLTPRYVLNRLLVIYDQHQNRDSPWLTADAVRILDQMIRPEDVGVEYGSGRSTIWLAKRLNKLTSIERDPVWHENVVSMLSKSSLTEKVAFRKCTSDDDYAAQTQTFDNESIDFCLVDGHVRDRCALGLVPKLKSNGIFVVDNVEWFLPAENTYSPGRRSMSDGPASDVWASFNEEVRQWRKIWTSNGVWDTCIWLKP
jgi:predicted O-methyltransferase YrrM